MPAGENPAIGFTVGVKGKNKPPWVESRIENGSHAQGHEHSLYIHHGPRDRILKVAKPTTFGVILLAMLPPFDQTPFYLTDKVVLERKDYESLLALRILRTEVDVLRTQLRGGNDDPRRTPTHPGYWLLQLGWSYHPDPDPYGCDWGDPACSGTGKRECHTLVAALGIALGRVLDRPNSFRLLSEEIGV